jgi:hypothetical protein
VLDCAKATHENDPECKLPGRIQYFNQEQFSKLSIQEKHQLVGDLSTFTVKAPQNYLSENSTAQHYLDSICEDTGKEEALEKHGILRMIHHQVNGESHTLHICQDINKAIDTTLRPLEHDGHAEKEEMPEFWDEDHGVISEEKEMLYSASIETMDSCQTAVLNCLDLEIDAPIPLNLQ